MALHCRQRPANMILSLILSFTLLQGIHARSFHFERRQNQTTIINPANASYPTAFDGSLGNNFTQQTCPNFFQQFLGDPTFVDCHPVSMMLQTSSSWFQALKSLVLLTRSLDASCAANAAVCAPLMSKYADQLLTQCADDYRVGNPLVTMAHSGFLSYVPIYSATCLRDNGNTPNVSTVQSKGVSNVTSTGYCFANAATNASNPTSVYTYYLPLGIGLPTGAEFECSWCLQQTMSEFYKFAGNLSQPLNQTYRGAANSIDSACGPNFVNANVQAPTSDAALSHSFGWLLWMAVIASLAMVV